MNEITILGRGKSLSKLKDFKSNSKEVILVNSFWLSPELSNASYVDDPIINNFLKNKKTTLVASPLGRAGTATSSSKGFDQKYNVKHKYNCIFSKGRRSGMATIGPDWQLMPESSRQLYESIGNSKIKKSGDYIPGSLAYACLVAITEMSATDIHIFGLDFYEKGYHQPQNYSKAAIDSHFNDKHVAQLKLDFCNFFNFFSDVHFNIHTLANFQCSNNVSVF